jgi:hypothetical protein
MTLLTLESRKERRRGLQLGVFAGLRGGGGGGGGFGLDGKLLPRHEARESYRGRKKGKGPMGNGGR